MDLSFYGGAGEVGRNCIGLREGNASLLMDCGINVGAKTPQERNPLLEDADARAYSQIAISHAHLDHTGYLPILYSNAKKCRAPIYVTKPTQDLMALLLADYQRLSNHFSPDDTKHVLAHCKPLQFNQTAGEKLKFSFHNAGHILGSAMTLVHSGQRLLYTSDFNNRVTRLLDACHQGLRAETLIMESTYGAKEDTHKPLKDVAKELIDAIETAIISGGSVLIPSFAVGRAQEVIFILEQHMTSGALSPVPIFVDGMILKANRIYRQNLEFAKPEVRRRLLHGGQDPFRSKHFHIPKTRTRSDVLNQQAIIVSTSGMLTGGPAITYMKALARDRNSLLAFVGYQSEGTPGRQIIDGAKQVELDGEKVRINMTVKKFDLSAHCDQAGLVQFARTTRALKRIFLVHGEKNKFAELKDALGKKYEIIVPKNGESFKV
ncbi:MAG: MBL fold metallo-hydrolase RNA specificity domain-containing protein [Candidatus Burarchaeum sp.]|nr:MBL fold metallo-hydrolase RNA specificity domain-containing protein [Candidatus Burarchaeum sp.]MDO8340122.1 MBL fold metallo-hydrolase RNA specificity domain-containing protein [Candidatus Burarchaeum sp.]